MTLLLNRGRNRMICRWWLAGAVSLVCAWPAHAQLLPRDPVLNMTLRRQLGMSSVADDAFEALNAAAEYARLRQSAADELTAARGRYWASYPDKPGFKEAEREFSRLLTRRELFTISRRPSTPACLRNR